MHGQGWWEHSKTAGKQGLPLGHFHWVSVFATEAAQPILGQEACAEQPNELTAVQILLDALLLKGAIDLFINATGTHSPNNKGLTRTRISPLERVGAAGRNRTHDPLVRSQVLYPAELQPHNSRF